MGLELSPRKYRENICLRVKLTQQNMVLREGQRPYSDAIVCEPLDLTIPEGWLKFPVM